MRIPSVSTPLASGLFLAGVVACSGPVLSRSMPAGEETGSDLRRLAQATHAPTPSAPARGTAPADQVIEEYCTSCHSERMQRGGLVLEGFDLEAMVADGRQETLEKIIRKLRAGMMPPATSRRRPEPATVEDVYLEVEAAVDEAAEERPGHRTFQRLNRAEYGRAVEELLGIRVDVSSFLPLDTKSANFDNIADVQMPSASVMEGYLRAAGHVARVALGDPDAGVANTVYRTPRVQSQKERVEGAPFGTRGGLSVVHNFPADGKYVFHVMPYGAVEGEVFGRTFGTEQLEVSIDGERVALLTIDRWMSESEPTGLNIRSDSIHVTAGPKRVTVAFIQQFEGVVDDLIRPIDHTLADGQIGIGLGVTTQQHLQRVTILGPFGVSGVSSTPTREAVFTCRPTAPEEERPCAEEILARLAEKAYRRHLEESDVSDLLDFYDQGARNGGFEVGVRTALQAILASPHFIFRMEEVPEGAEAGRPYRISDVDLASRLSFFLWGAPPDAALLATAEDGRLSEQGELRSQVDRMLADPRAEALATRFAAQWLRLQDLEDIHPDALTYPYFDQTLADAMRRETELLFRHLVADDRPVMELMTADYTFVNERLARHYGISGVIGPEFRMVSYPDDRRRGLLGHGSILTLTSHPDRTSPVLRGKWVLEVLLGTPPPPPPPGIPDLEESSEAADGRFLSVRERLEEHRSNPACRSCHLMMDPIGLALENFDVTGAWRHRDEGNLVDPTTELYDGTPMAGPEDLRNALLQRPEVFYRIFTENLMAYALGRRVEYYDMPTIRAITQKAAQEDYRLSSFVRGIVESPAFGMMEAASAVTDAAQGG